MKVPLTLDKDTIIWVEEVEYETMRNELDALFVLKMLFPRSYQFSFTSAGMMKDTIDCVFMFISVVDDGEIVELAIEFKLDNLDLIDMTLNSDYNTIAQGKDIFEKLRELLSTFKN